MKTKLIISIIILNIIFLLSSCKQDNNGNNNSNNNDTVKLPDKENPLTIEIDKKSDGNFFIGDLINIRISIKEKSDTDSIILYINNKQEAILRSDELSFNWDTKETKVGRNLIKIELNKLGKRFSKQTKLVIYSDKEPENYTYKVIKTYKHDVKAYTQGLFYDNGFLYEATGMKGESTVRKVIPETGEVIQSFAIPKDVFGEGIVLLNDKIIQLSWQAGRGFVYDYSTFKLTDEFIYNGEGWGICTDGKYLYMSNGSHQIKVLEAQTYSEINILEVYDNEGPVNYLNEMEFIKGYIYANIYQYEKIVKFDPSTGKVVAYVDLSGILPMNDYASQTDVLNGIAYDTLGDRIFVTGKNWPKLFEIGLIKK